MTANRNRLARRSVYVIAPVVALLVGFLAFRGCTRPPTAREALFVPHDLARLKSLDRTGILAYCRDEVRTVNYAGIQRGPHGTLWAGEGNAWDKVLLAVAALEGAGIEARAVPGDPPRVACRADGRWLTGRVDVAAPDDVSAAAPEGALSSAELAQQRPDLFHTLTAALVLERSGAAPQRIAASQPERLADLAAQPIFVEAHDNAGGTSYVLRAGSREILDSGPLGDVNRASLELTWKFQEQSATWRRELFDRANGKNTSPGKAAPHAGDRFAVAVAAGPLVPDVLKTRARMMELADYTPERDEAARRLFGLAVKYQVDSDERARALAAECGVQVSWSRPRVTIAAGAPSGASLTIDTLADAVEAEGRRAREFHVARGLANDLIETRIIFEATHNPVVSASTVFSNYKSDMPDGPARRIALIKREAERVLRSEPIGTSVRFTASPHPALNDDDRRALPAAPPHLALVRTAKGLAVRGLTRTGEPTAAEPWTAFDWQENGLVEFAGVPELAVAIDGMLCRKMGRADYLLDCQVESARPLRQLPIVDGSLLTYAARFKDREARLMVRVGLKNGLPQGTWTDPAGAMQTIAAAAWPEVLTPGPAGAQLRSFLAPDLPASGETVRHKLLVGLNEREIEGRRVELPGGSATLLPAAHFPLVLSWQKGELSLRLESASPVVLGQVRDADSDRPVFADVVHTRAVTLREPKPIDLRRWKQEGPPAHGKWETAPDGASVLQTINGDPTFFVSPDEYIDTTIRGKLRVDDTSDDDYIGFVFGYQSPLAQKGDKPNNYEFLLFDWKKQNQPPAREGFALVRVHGEFKVSNYDDTSFWTRRKSPQFEILAENHRAGTGWKHQTDHEFELTYTRSQIRISVDGKVIFDVAGSFRPGRFGFYNYSQAQVRYQGFSTLTQRQAHIDLVRTATAADGSYALSAVARPPRLLLVLDRSGSMVFSLDPKDGTRGRKDRPAPKGEQRIDHVRRSVASLLEQIPPAVEVALWSFSGMGFRATDFDTPNMVRVDCPYTTDRARLKKALERIEPEQGTPISGAVYRIINHLKEDPSAETTVVMMTDGENSGSHTPAEAYRRGQGSSPIHTIGFAIEPKGKAEQQLSELARVSGGSYRIAGSGEALKLAFGRFSTLPDLTARFESSCHAPDEITVPAAELGRDRQDVWLFHGCATCRCSDKGLLTITRGTLPLLDQCQGLSPKARRMIEERVSDGAWSVTIPSRRVDVGAITAYGWWETESATGRMVGRTEDGLHGSSAAGSDWPSGPIGTAGQIPFVAWFTGLTQYTAGSVLAGLRWCEQPGFASGTPEDFVRFVQANALEHCAQWWNDVGAGAFPENMHNYWSGVCLNFTLQSMATRMPSADCFRHWAQALCNQASGAIKDWPADKFNEMFNARFGDEWRDLYERLQKLLDALDRAGLAGGEARALADEIKGLQDGLDRIKSGWEEGVDRGLDCGRFTRPARAAARPPQ